MSRPLQQLTVHVFHAGGWHDVRHDRADLAGGDKIRRFAQLRLRRVARSKQADFPHDEIARADLNVYVAESRQHNEPTSGRQ